MYVVKRDGRTETIQIVKITKRITKLGYDLNTEIIDINSLSQKVGSGLYDGIKTNEIDDLAAETAASMTAVHPDYAQLASRIAVSNLHKLTCDRFSDVADKMKKNMNNGKQASLIAEDVYKIIQENKEKIDKEIKYDRDFDFDYFGFKTLERSYLFRVNKEIIERPQHMFMRVSIGIHKQNIDEAIQTYHMLSKKLFTHASPTLFNASTPRPQLSSCFVKNTNIYTSQGIKPIQNIKIGDEVITHKSRFQKVTQIHVNEKGERRLFDFKAFLTPTITATGNHSFMSITSEQIEWDENPQWNQLDHLRVGDWIEIPAYDGTIDNPIIDVYQSLKTIIDDGNNIKYVYNIEKYNNKIQPISTWRRMSNLNNSKGKMVDFKKNQQEINRYWIVDNDFMKFLGIWYGDGHVIKEKNSKRVQVPKGIGITIGSDNIGCIDFCVKYGTSLLGFEPIIHRSKKQNCVQVLFNSKATGYLFTDLFGQYFDNKFLYKGIHDWSTSLIESFIGGLVTSDGFVTKDGCVRVGMCNPKFVKDVYNLARSRGIFVSYCETDQPYMSKHDGPKTSRVAWMTIPKESAYLCSVNKTYTDGRLEKYANMVGKSSCILTYKGKKFVRIMMKKPSLRDDNTVYNIGVENDHSYMVDGLIAKNCFLTCMKDDSIEGIYDTIKECAIISKNAGGIGIPIHNIRATNSYIKGTNGTSNGIVPMLRVFNNTARYVDQGGGKRKGAFAIYLEPWHADIFDFIELRKNHGKEETRCRDLFLALWVPDLFMKRVEANQEWYLFCPNQAQGLQDVYGEEFERLYERYVNEKKFMKKVSAQKLWFAILEAQIETGTPFMLYKDACNLKSNQKNLGTIKSSNLCTEIIQYSSPTETAVCNLASIALSKFVQEIEPQNKKINGSLECENRQFNFELLGQVVKLVTYNLNKIIDINFYPCQTARISNIKHRPIGLGVQGLADVFITLGISFESKEAKKLNKDIFETIYFNALEASCELAKKNGTYQSYTESPISKGILQPDMWNVETSQRWKWNELRKKISKYGVRNSLLVALMPTASTSQILGNNECIEPYTSNIYVRRVLSGEFTVVNKHLVKDLMQLGLWNQQIKDLLIASNGSVQYLPIPEKLKLIYKTVWEIKQKNLVDLAADRGAFIDQSQSFNVHMIDVSFAKLTSLHFHSWKLGVKTGMYYLRSRPASDAIKFTLDKSITDQQINLQQQTQFIGQADGPFIQQNFDQCSLSTNTDQCLQCGS